MKTNIFKKFLKISLILFVVIFIVGLFVGNFFYDLALNSTINKSEILDAPHNLILSPEEEAEAYVEARQEGAREQWMQRTGYTDKYMTSFDGLRLHAYEMKNPKAENKWVVICHGYAGQGLYMIETAKKFYDMGFNVLMPDARGHGLSEGHYIGMGWNERRDIVQWTNNIVNQDDKAEIALYGLSMGAATVMMAAGEADLPTHVKVIVEDSGYSSIEAEFAYQLQALYNLPAFPILNFSSLITKTRAGFWLSDGNVVAQVSKSITPMLFIHGDSDTFVPSSMVEEVYVAANVPKEKLIVAGAGHGGSVDVAPEKYWRTIENFIFQYITR